MKTEKYINIRIIFEKSVIANLEQQFKAPKTTSTIKSD